MTAIINTTKTYNFNPSLGELVLTAFARIGLRASELTPNHMYHARIAANLVLSEWSNFTPNLWEVGLQTMPLIQGTATYSVPAETVTVLDLYITFGTPSTDRYLYPVSRTEYSAYPNKTQQAFPNVYWFDRLISPTVTFWPVPDGNGPYVANYYSVRQTQDAALPNANTVEIPYRFLDAFAAALAWRLSEIYAPAAEPRMAQKMERAWALASKQDVENVPLQIMPGLSGYWSR